MERSMQAILKQKTSKEGFLRESVVNTRRTEEALNSIVKLAELTAAIRELLEIIALKRRQINRIRFKIIPQLDATIRYVELILEEIERQDAIRVRVLQRKRKERAVKTL